jgi:cellulose synthase operon protein B
MSIFFTKIIIAAFISLAITSCENKIVEPIVPEKVNESELKVFNWFKHMQLENGTLPSSVSAYVSLYDNALAAMVFIIYDDIPRAERIFDFFDSRIESEFHSDSGGFSQFRYKNGNPVFKHQWMGDNAWLLMALNNYKVKTGSAKYDRLASELENWIVNLQDTDGSLFSGYEGNKRINLKVTEGIIDAFNAVPGYTDFHKKILQFLEKERWNADISSLVTGWNLYNYALDLHPWAYCIFENFPVETLIEADMYLVTMATEFHEEEVTGYCFDLDKDNIWFEGVGQMVVAFNEAGLYDQSAFYLSELEKVMIQNPDVDSILGITYASNGNSTRFGGGELYEPEYTESFVSSGAWYLFGVKKFNPFGVERKKMIPEADMFWKR